MRVKHIQTGQLGDIPDNKFDPAVFQKVGMDTNSAVGPAYNPAPAKKDNILTSVAKAVVKPGVDFANLVMGTGFEATRAVDSALGNKSAYDVYAGGKGQKNPFMSKEEIQKDYSNPADIALNTTKKTAAAGSYFVPAGKLAEGAGVGAKVLAGAAQGAKSGALYGFGESDKKDLEGMAVDTAVGGVSGGVTGGVLTGAGEAVKGLRGAGNDLRQGVIKPQVKASPTMASKKAAIAEGTQALGMKGSAANQEVQMDKIYKDLGNKVSAKLTGQKVDLNPVLEGFDDAIKNNSNKLPGYETWVKHFGDIVLDASDKGNKISDKSLYGLKGKIADQIGKAFEKEQGTSQVPLTAKEDVGLAIWHKIDDLLVNTEGIDPGVKDLTLQMSNLYKASPGIAKQAEASLTLPVVGRVPGVAGVVQSAQDATGRAMQSVGGVGGQIADAALPSAMRVAPIAGASATMQPQSDGMNIDNATGTPPMQQDVQGAETQQPAGQNDQYDIQSDGNAYSKDGQWMFDKTQNDWVPAQSQGDQGNGGIDFTNEDTVVQLMQHDLAATGGKNIPEIKTMFETATAKKGGAGKTKVTGGQAKEISDIQTSIGLMDGLTPLIDENASVMGPIQGRLNETNEYDTKSQTFSSNMKAAAQMVGRAMEGGVLRQEDVPKYEKMLPQVHDTPDLARAKVQNVRRMLELQLETKNRVYQNYDTTSTYDPTIAAQ